MTNFFSKFMIFLASPNFGRNGPWLYKKIKQRNGIENWNCMSNVGLAKYFTLII